MSERGRSLLNQNIHHFSTSQRYVDSRALHLFAILEHFCPKSQGLMLRPITAFTLVGRLSTCFWKAGAEICFHSASRALMSCPLMLGDKCLAHSQRFDSSHKFSVRLRSGPCAGQAKHRKPFRFVHGGGIVMVEQERTFPELLPQCGKDTIV